MEIQCHCSSCGAQFKTASRFAGRKVRCPKCAGEILVPPAPAPPTQEAPMPAARLVRRRPDAGKSKAERPATSPRPCPTCGLPLGDGQVLCPACGCDLALANVVNTVSESRQPPSQPNPLPIERAGQRSKKIVWILSGGGMVILLAIIAAVSIGPRLPSKSASSPAAPAAVLVLQWPASERFTGSVQIDGRNAGLPEKGAVEYPLEPGKHRVQLTRQGYEPIELNVSLKQGERWPYAPEWTLAKAESSEASAEGAAKAGPGSDPGLGKDLVNLDDWLQDFEAAKKKAAAEHKDILVAFLGPDGFSIRLCYEVLFQKEFRDRVDGRYVLVWIDLSRDSQSRGRVQDLARNLRLVRDFRVAQLPRVVATDAAGFPFAVQGYGEGGVEGFLIQLSGWQAVRVERDRIFHEIDSAPPEKKPQAIDKGLAILRDLKLTQFHRLYRPILDSWLALAQLYDAQNDHGTLESIFQVHWALRLAETNPDSPDPQAVAALVAELEAWKTAHAFHNPDRAAMLHLLAADRLLGTRQSAAALKYLEAGLGCQPKDPVLREQLAGLAASIRGVGVGTCFVVGPNLLLTNSHVVDGPAKTLVKLPDQPEPVPAEVVARDAQQDIALLKIAVPEGMRLAPLPLAAADVARGAKVSAFGYPGSAAVGSGLKLTTGIVSATPDESSQGMLLLDCRVNPGNSGGPLCDVYGEVVGMVSAKSLGGIGVESYGMALPAAALRRFLAEHVPSLPKNAAASPRRKPLEWEAIDRLVGRSVLLIVRAP